MDDAGTNAIVSNGSYGAGGVVLKGYFEVSVDGVEGSAPPDVQNIYLKGVDSSSAK